MKRIWLLVLSLILLNSGCIKKGDLNFKNIQVDNWTPDWALPLLTANLSLGSLVDTNTTITIDPTGLYTLHYTGPLFSVNAATYIKIPDQSFSTQFTLTPSITSPSFTGSVSDSGSGHYSFTDTSGAQLSHIIVKSGNLNVNLSNTFNQNISLNIVFPGITKNGNSLSLNSTITYPATTSSINADLSGYTIDLTDNGTSSNYFAYKMIYTLSGSGQPMSASNSIAAAISLTGMQYSFIDGFLGRYNIPIPNDTINIGVFDKNITANVYLKNPSLNLSFSNSFGISVSTVLDSIFGITDKNQQVNFNMPPIPINQASSAGTTALTNFIIDSSNSSIQYIFNPGPNRVVYQGYLSLNPGLSSGYNFVEDTSTLSLLATANLPACFKIIQLSLGDTTKLSLPQDTSVMQSAEFKLQMDNGLPLYGSLQLYFADSNYVTLDSLIVPNSKVIQQAPVDANGIVTGHTIAATEFILQHDRYNAMAPKVAYAIIVGNLYTSGANTVQILNVNYLNVKLACRFTLNVSQGKL